MSTPAPETEGPRTPYWVATVAGFAFAASVLLGIGLSTVGSEATDDDTHAEEGDHGSDDDGHGEDG